MSLSKTAEIEFLKAENQQAQETILRLEVLLAELLNIADDLPNEAGREKIRRKIKQALD